MSSPCTGPRSSPGNNRLKANRANARASTGPQTAQGNYDSRDNERKNVAVLGTLLRGKAPDIPVEAVAEYLTSTPEGQQKFAILLSQEAKQLLAMDRYERRAFRRRIAIQVLIRLSRGDAPSRAGY